MLVPFFKPIIPGNPGFTHRQLFQKLITSGSNANPKTCNQSLFNMDTTKQATQPQSQTMQSIDWLFQDRDEDDFDLIEFGIASNGGRLSIKGA